ncbi:hypothetical protein NUW54_g12336 [Trametes sanguinea]|uniref:Uncharacterized protein n=1 Tax=Trametes sanguinea TaxID=158606 RepID=A0ACC1N022_9APHY|nr:hypothetical protein NUW54_g12336 [Trametes sanguinea]
MKTPIDQLPPQVLLEVFAYVKDFDWSADNKEPWYRLLWVCRWWRQLVTGTPTLWNHVDISSYMKRDLVEACLIYSKQAPLDIEISGTSTAQNAWICGMKEVADEALKTLLGKTMPVLEGLVVSFNSDTRPRGPYPLPDFRPCLHEPKEPFLWDLSTECSPSLRVLSLGGAIKINGPLPMFPWPEEAQTKRMPLHPDDHRPVRAVPLYRFPSRPSRARPPYPCARAYLDMYHSR